MIGYQDNNPINGCQGDIAPLPNPRNMISAKMPFIITLLQEVWPALSQYMYIWTVCQWPLGHIRKPLVYIRPVIIPPVGCFSIKKPSYQYRIPIMKIKCSHNCLIFIMEIIIPGMMPFLCLTSIRHFSVGIGFFLSNWAFFCRNVHFAVNWVFICGSWVLIFPIF